MMHAEALGMLGKVEEAEVLVEWVQETGTMRGLVGATIILRQCADALIHSRRICFFPHRDFLHRASPKDPAALWFRAIFAYAKGNLTEAIRSLDELRLLTHLHSQAS